MNERKILNGGKKRTQFGGPKERKAKRTCQKAMTASKKVVFALTSPTKVQARIFTKNKGRRKDQKGKGKEGTLEGYGQAWKSDDWSGWFCTKAHTAWIVATTLNLANHPTHVVLDLGCTRSIGSRTAIERFKKRAYYGITTEFCPSSKSFVFASSETEKCKESCIIHFPTIPPCSTKVDVLETGDVPILFFPFAFEGTYIMKDGDCVTEFRIRSPDLATRIWPPGFGPTWVSASPSSESVARTLRSKTSVHVCFTLMGTTCLFKGAASILDPKAGAGGTSDSFGVMVPLLSAAVMCFRAWVRVKVLRRRVLSPLLAAAGRCYRAQPLINIEGVTTHKHGTTCAAELFYLRHVRSCAASAF